MSKELKQAIEENTAKLQEISAQQQRAEQLDSLRDDIETFKYWAKRMKESADRLGLPVDFELFVKEALDEPIEEEYDESTWYSSSC